MAIKEKKQKSPNPSPSSPKRGSSWSRQFQGLDFHNPAAFPALPRFILLAAISIIVLVLLWMVWLKNLSAELDVERQQEETLRKSYVEKLPKAASLSAIKIQKKQVEQYVDSLEKQLPGKSEMDALLSDINQAGIERNLQFDLFKPGTVVLQQYYAELPISLKITGHYHDIGAFAADIASLSRIVTLNELNLTPLSKKQQQGELIFTATARTFRYLDPEEIKSQAQAQSKGKGNKK